MADMVVQVPSRPNAGRNPVIEAVSRHMICRSALLAVCLLVSAALVADPVRVRVVTNLGDIVLALDQGRAPVTVANFLSYVDEGSYNGTIFHRVIPGFAVQGGGLYPDLSEAPDKQPILNEADNGLKNVRGSVAMARYEAIDSATRQFFINLADNGSLDHTEESCTRQDEARREDMQAKGIYRPASCRTFGYAVFGHVESGIGIVDLIEMMDTHTLGHHTDLPIRSVIIFSIERLASPGSDN